MKNDLASEAVEENLLTAALDIFSCLQLDNEMNSLTGHKKIYFLSNEIYLILIEFLTSEKVQRKFGKLNSISFGRKSQNNLSSRVS